MSAPEQVDLSALIERQPVGGFVVRLLLVSMLVTFLDGFDLMAISYAAPVLAPELGLSKAMLGNVFSIGTFGTMLGAVVAGWAGDRFGRRPAVIWSTAAFAVLTLAIALAHGYAALLALRFVQGLALAGAVPLLWALNMDYAPRSRRATVVTLVTLGFGLGAALAGPIANALIPRFGWPSLFVFGGLASLATTLLLLFALPESLRRLHGLGRPAGQVARAVRRFAPAETLPPDPVFVLSDEPSAGAKVRLGRLFEGDLKAITPLIWLAYLASSLTTYLLAFWGPILFEAMGFERATAAYITSFNSLAGAVGGLILMRFTDRLGPQSVAAMPALAVPLMLLVGLAALPGGIFIALSILLAGLLTGGHYGVMSIIGLYYPSDVRASGSGWASTVAKIGSVVGPQVGAVLLASQLPPRATFAVLAVCPLVLGLCVLAIAAIGRRRTADPTQAAALSPAR